MHTMSLQVVPVLYIYLVKPVTSKVELTWTGVRLSPATSTSVLINTPSDAFTSRLDVLLSC